MDEAARETETLTDGSLLASLSFRMVTTMLINALLTITLTFGDAHDRSAADAVFVGRTPCGPEARSFLAIPSNAPCQFIAWNLALSADGTSRAKVGVVPSQDLKTGAGTRMSLRPKLHTS